MLLLSSCSQINFYSHFSLLVQASIFGEASNIGMLELAEQLIHLVHNGSKVVTQTLHEYISHYVANGYIGSSCYRFPTIQYFTAN